MEKDFFKEYLKETEPDKAGKGYVWSTAIGLQAVDGLRPSRYLIDTAIQNIEGEITLKEAQRLIDTYYEEKPAHSDDERTEEADRVSARIAGILSEMAFSFSPNEYISIHRKLFRGIYEHAGKIRDYNITKREWVLNGETVIYGSASELKATLEYDFSQEKSFSYKGLTIDETIHHLAVFVANLWQIHIFEEGNTRTTAVFFIKYLRTLGFSVTNDIFAENAWYFRNALVRANYTNLQKGIHETTEYLELFLRNLLLHEKNELHNRELHVSGIIGMGKVDIGEEKVDIQEEKADIGEEKVDIQEEKADIRKRKVDIQEQESDCREEEADITEEETDVWNKQKDAECLLAGETGNFSAKTSAHIQAIFEQFGYDEIFGRSAITGILGLQNSSASRLLSRLVRTGIIEPVSGHGKGKYRFRKNGD
ncbi:Fic family protein [Marvinbryantia formatexigens DSM 14469]|uniref:Fic family protein n=1 Tax=Marvinbryantia formatexigens TaxID=168384 RepID=UPI00059482E5|nr:Fic family protein [Marvinbryantia formatexigens]UWO26892.1 Fic family protein [Marvinbryantia formatexigens DSM 14469]